MEPQRKRPAAVASNSDAGPVDPDLEHKRKISRLSSQRLRQREKQRFVDLQNQQAELSTANLALKRECNQLQQQIDQVKRMLGLRSTSSSSAAAAAAAAADPPPPVGLFDATSLAPTLISTAPSRTASASASTCAEDNLDTKPPAASDVNTAAQLWTSQAHIQAYRNTPAQDDVNGQLLQLLQARSRHQQQAAAAAAQVQMDQLRTMLLLQAASPSSASLPSDTHLRTLLLLQNTPRQTSHTTANAPLQELLRRMMHQHP